MATILSIQSHVSYGYVGNRVATFALQRLGHDVITVNTVQFSNHTGYGSWQGDIFSKEHIKSVWQGIKQRLAISNIDALLTGYLGDVELGELVKSIAKEIKQANPAALYCLDPVFGDVGRGIFAKLDLADYFRDTLINSASLMTPNHFEFDYITQQQNKTIEELNLAAQKLFESGTTAILVTSYQGNEVGADEIGMVLLMPTERWLIKTPKITFTTPPNGSGDLVSSLLLEKWLKQMPPKDALAQVAEQIYTVFSNTKFLQHRELAIIQSQGIFDVQHSQFIAVPS